MHALGAFYLLMNKCLKLYVNTLNAELLYSAKILLVLIFNCVTFHKKISTKIFDTRHSFHTLTARASMYNIPELSCWICEIPLKKALLCWQLLAWVDDSVMVWCVLDGPARLVCDSLLCGVRKGHLFAMFKKQLLPNFCNHTHDCVQYCPFWPP